MVGALKATLQLPTKPATPWPVVISTNQPSEVWTTLESNAYDAGTTHAAGFSIK
jgi:hypothetical protein